MPTLYTMPGTCSLSPNIAVAWLKAPVEIHNMPYGDQKKEYYLAIDPRGKVPALRFEDGDVLTEATAILAWLGSTYGKESYASSSRLGRKEAEALGSPCDLWRPLQHPKPLPRARLRRKRLS